MNYCKDLVEKDSGLPQTIQGSKTFAFMKNMISKVIIALL